MLAGLDVLPADDHCRMAHARQYARQRAAANAAALYARNDSCPPDFDVELSALYAPDYVGAAVLNGLHARDAWYSFARTCHETALSHRVRPGAAPTHTVPVVVGRSERATCKDIRNGIITAALIRRGLRQPLHAGGLHGRPRAPSQLYAPCGWQTTVDPSRGISSSSGTLPSGRFTPMRPRRMCTWVYHCGIRILSDIIFFTTGPPLLPSRAVSARTAFPPHAWISGLLL